MRSVSVAGRIAAIVAVVVAVVVVAVLIFSSGGGYTVKADFINAGQLVTGDQVEVAGAPVGSINGIALTGDGQAEITMSVKPPYQPLRVGTHATVREASLSGISNRYIDLSIPPGDNRSSPTIPNGGVIPATDTTTAVDLDQVFDTFDPTARVAVQDFFRNSAAQLQGKEAQQQLAFHYLNPALSTSSRLFGELNADTPELVRFLTDSAGLVTTLAQKRDTLTNLISNLNTTFTALGNQKAALANDVQRLPGFMRQANTTFVDLRSALDQVDPLVNASKPVALKLQQFLPPLRNFADNAVPTVRDLSRIVFQPGPNNDLYDLEQSLPPLASAALDTSRRSVNEGAGNVSVGTVPGSFPTSTKALRTSAPLIAFGRPYTLDLLGWFDDFSTPGAYDAEGNFSRTQNIFNAFDLQTEAGPVPIPLLDRLTTATTLTRVGQYKRCPGGADQPAADGSNVLTPALQQQYDCTESARAAGSQK